MSPALKHPAIGIDLGTTKSCVGLFRDGKVEIIGNNQGIRTTPSCVAFTETGRLIGDEAKNQAALNSPNIIFSAKRLIGRTSEDPVVQADAAFWPFQIVKAEGKPQKHQEDISKDRRAVWRLRRACEAAKRTLSSNIKASIDLYCLYKGIDFHADITRAQFEELCADLFRGTLKPVERALQDAKLSQAQIHDVVLVGASTRIPKIQELLQDFFGGRQLNKSLNPDEAVAYGAAVQAAILIGERSEVTRGLLALDVVSMSLGIETDAGKMHTLIRRNTAIPAVVTRTFTTFDDHQPDLLIRAYEGERATAKENHLLGRFRLKDISPAPRGMVLVEATFYINADGILTVFAVDKVAGNANPITVDANKGRLSREEIQKLAAEAEKYRAEDRAQKWKLATKNYLQSCAFSMKRTSEDILNYFTLQAKKKVMEKCQLAFSWLSPTGWLKRRRSLLPTCSGNFPPGQIGRGPGSFSPSSAAWGMGHLLEDSLHLEVFKPRSEDFNNSGIG
uniref:Heat shock protein 70 n=1 Tax=Chrysemys picta bellii TaxID=8478 RepID=A0A8C3FYS2_CHRPI